MDLVSALGPSPFSTGEGFIIDGIHRGGNGIAFPFKIGYFWGVFSVFGDFLAIIGGLEN